MWCGIMHIQIESVGIVVEVNNSCRSAAVSNIFLYKYMVQY